MKPKRAALYTRVSTDEQNTEAQERADQRATHPFAAGGTVHGRPRFHSAEVFHDLDEEAVCSESDFLRVSR